MPPEGSARVESQQDTVITVFAVGAAVRVHGLIQRPELNGCLGKLTEDKGGRWGTQLEEHPLPVSLKTSNLQLRMPEGYWQLVPGSLAEIHGLQSPSDLNGKVASLAQNLGECWLVQVEGTEDMVSLKPSNLSPLASRPLASTSWESDLSDLEALATMVVQELLEGHSAYPVVRRLGRMKATQMAEELYPVGSRSARLLPHTWSDLEIGESERIFYKMSLCSRCNQVNYMFTDIINQLADVRAPVFRGSEIAGMFLCVGFVVHAYRQLHIGEDFGQAYWQHSQKVHNGSRNHIWLEFPLPGAPPSDESARLILDLSAAQFDMCSPGKRFGLVRGQDPRYKKCYELPSTMVPLHFLKWSAALNNVRFEAQHCIKGIRIFREKLGLSGGFSCLDAHGILVNMLDRIGVVAPGQLLAEAMESPDIKQVEQACGMKLGALLGMNDDAARSMRAELGEGPMPENGG